MSPMSNLHVYPLLCCLSTVAWLSGIDIHRRFHITDAAPCPRVYIYDLQSLWDYKIPLDYMAEHGRRAIWGNKCGDGSSKINQYSLSIIIIYRLLTSTRCPASKNPVEADLFLIPALPSPKSARQFCPSGSIDEDNITQLLTFLNPTTAHKHFFLLGKGHPNFRSCGSWWDKPVGLLRHSVRVTYSMPYRTGKTSIFSGYGPVDASLYGIEEVADHTSDFMSSDVPYPHTFSVPYPATGHLGGHDANLPWQNIHIPRPYLMHFSGGLHGAYGVNVRRKIIQDCANTSRWTCIMRSDKINKDICEVFKSKKQARFCLEPSGDSPPRKSMYDSISLGCIPVIFTPYLQLISPWHWGHIYTNCSIYINQQEYLAGRINLVKVLTHIDATNRSIIQQNIAKHGHNTQYSQQDYPDDAFERLLLGVSKASHLIRQNTLTFNATLRS